jgi:anti-sigma regulatory factor (Ser/Thr protein kinase)
MSEAITLTVPFERPYQGVVRLVLGGVAARLDLPYETLEDVQLAVETILGNESYAAGETVSVVLEVDEAGLVIAVGPLERDTLAAELDASDETRGVGLGRLLAATMGEHEVEARDGHGWLRMRKALGTMGEAPA